MTSSPSSAASLSRSIEENLPPSTVFGEETTSLLIGNCDGNGVEDIHPGLDRARTPRPDVADDEDDDDLLALLDSALSSPLTPAGTSFTPSSSTGFSPPPSPSIPTSLSSSERQPTPIPRFDPHHDKRHLPSSDATSLDHPSTADLGNRTIPIVAEETAVQGRGRTPSFVNVEPLPFDLVPSVDTDVAAAAATGTATAIAGNNVGGVANIPGFGGGSSSGDGSSIGGTSAHVLHSPTPTRVRQASPSLLSSHQHNAPGNEPVPQDNDSDHHRHIHLDDTNEEGDATNKGDIKSHVNAPDSPLTLRIRSETADQLACLLGLPEDWRPSPRPVQAHEVEEQDHNAYLKYIGRVPDPLKAWSPAKKKPLQSQISMGGDGGGSGSDNGTTAAPSSGITVLLQENENLRHTIEFQNKRLMRLESQMMMMNWRVSGYDTWLLKNHHQQGVLCSCVDDTGDFIATGSMDKTVLVWEVKIGQCIRRLRGHRAGVYSLAADGPNLVSGSADKTIRVWNFASGEFLCELAGHTGTIYSCIIRGNAIASGSGDRTVRLWDLQSRSCIRVLDGHRGSVSCLDFHPEEKYIISGSYDNTIRIWDLTNGECLQVLKGHGTFINCVHHHGTVLASGSNDNSIRLWDLRSGECIRELTRHSDWVNSLQMVNETVLVSASKDKSVRVWNVKTGECIRVLKGHTDVIHSLQLRGNLLCTASEDKTVRVWRFLFF